ncbi:MAG: hypothetical protein ACPG4X_16855 [Pikeienuella sp.]
MLHVVQFKQQIRAGKPPIDMVLLAPEGAGNDRTRTWHRVSRIMPPEDAPEEVRNGLSYQDMAAKWSVIGPKYEAWKKGHEIPEDGTPLGAWSGITQEQGEHLRKMGILTVEAIANMGDRTVAQLSWPDARKLPGLAKAFLSGEDTAAKDAEMAEMREKMAAMEALLEEYTKAPTSKPKRAKDEAA